MSGFKPSPGEAAKVLVAKVPDFVGMLRIDGLTPGGRGGWMTKSKWSRFWLDHGSAYGVRTSGLTSTPLFAAGFRYASNGPCAICGAYSAKPSRVTAFAPDPQAGELIGTEPSWKVPVYAAAMAGVTACPDCVASHGLTAGGDWNFYRTVRNEDKVVAVIQLRHHPLGTYQAPVLVADIRPVQSGKADLASVEIREWIDQDGLAALERV